MESQESTPYQNSLLIPLPRGPRIPYTNELEDPSLNRPPAPRSSIRYKVHHSRLCSLVASCNYYIKMLFWMQETRSDLKRSKSAEEHTGWNNDQEQQNYNSNNETHPHFHVLIPHGLPDTVCSTSEALCGYGEVIGLVLERI